MDALRADGYTVADINNYEAAEGATAICMSLTTEVTAERIASFPDGCALFARDLTDDAVVMAKRKNIRYINYFADEGFIVKNAYLTAEGALAHIIQNTDCSLVGMRVLILGYGRVGKAVAKVLKDNYVSVSVMNRSPFDRANAALVADNTYSMSEYEEHLKEFSVIVNTIPELILKGEQLEKLGKDCFILDLASKPGGVDFNEADRLNIKTLLALGIPGKVAPKDAGLYLKAIVTRNLG